MRILGIDPGTKCGWALREPSGSMTSGVWQLKHGRHDSDGMKVIRLHGYLDEIYNATPFDLIAYEEVRRHMGTDAAHCYGAIVSKIQAWVIDHNQTRDLSVDPVLTGVLCAPVNHTGIPVGTVKKFATGKGNASKQMMIDAAFKKWLPHIEVAIDLAIHFDDNEADARWIAECAASQLGATQ